MADRDSQMVCWCVIFTLSDNEESLALSEEAAAECVCVGCVCSSCGT